MNWWTVIILPDEYAMIPYQEYNKDQEDVLFVSGDMTDVRRAQAWIDIANGKFRVIYWTRRIIYYNLSQYTHILYIEDALGPDYWHYPIRIRYSDILDIFRVTNPNKNITILTSIPTLTTLAHFRHYPIENISALWKKI
jgi:phosphoribosylpyrophosphate synthetase